MYIPQEGILMKSDTQRKLLTRINRISGQIAGVQRMVEEDRYCVQILHQISAVRSALDSLGIELLTKHLESCVIKSDPDAVHECAKPMTQAELLEEVRTLIGQFLK
jgi:CsoR family transcriptional regulator, copper-sensing transcriptional repressor